VKKLYRPPPEQDYSSNYIRLVVVIVISIIFIGGEVVAGIIANSIAIISDAVHLVSDTIAFVFSILFLYLSKKRPNTKMTFGYHRMELLGALANIFIIWFLIIFVMYEATLRVIAKEFVEKPFVMLIAAGGGLVVNIAMYKVLHGGATHSHGLLADACHGHDHDHGH
jgi:cation diffusion facilitator family transporter